MELNNLPTAMRAKQLSSEFGIGLSTIWSYSKQGKITPIKVSPKVTIFKTAEVLEAFNMKVYND